jgi:PAS domain S-box-containing protein
LNNTKTRSRQVKDPSIDPKQALRQQAEAISRERTNRQQESQKALSPEQSRKVLHELQVHQIELEMQNEELRRTQGELEMSRERYFNLYDLAPMGYFTLSKEGLILEANLTATAQFGVARSGMVKQPLSRFIFHEDQDIYYLHSKQLFKTGRSPVCELRMVRKDDLSFWAQMETTLVQDAGGASVCRAVISDISERKKAERKLTQSLTEKEALLKELHHRVKNNLQVICSLLNLQSRRIQNDQDLRIFKECQNRVRSMALVHEKMYLSEDLAHLDFRDYITGLAAELLRSYQVSGSHITLKTDIDEVKLTIDRAMPLGLLINELISNTLKHAFPNQKCGEIAISLRATSPDRCTLAVADNGVGLPEGVHAPSSSSLGMQIIHGLCLQLQGAGAYAHGPGTRFEMTF